ncbi:MAG TPA: hypothetical protein VFT42_02850 [Solirubrobacteraceae bacterium]|nr:hypothetical protein [Solirubrobacteraceae bacterium]
MDRDEWRVVAATSGGNEAAHLERALHDHEPGEEALDRVALTRDDTHVFAYAADRAGAEAAKAALRHVLLREGVKANVALQRWHHGEERWEDPGAPADATAEAAALTADEREDSAEEGAEWEVRVDLGNHRDAKALAKRLREEGLPVWRGWRFLIVGAASEADAEALAQRIRSEAPAGAKVQTEGAPGYVARVARRANPFTPF